MIGKRSLSQVVGIRVPDIYDKAERSEVMRAVRSKGTEPEIAVRKLLHALGYRFRVNRHDLPGRPDVVLPKHHKVILVHGCFWHQHPGCKSAARPKTNIDFWNRKLDRNIQRDLENIAALTAAGWKVLVIWGCQTRDKEHLRRIILDFMGA